MNLTNRMPSASTCFLSKIWWLWHRSSSTQRPGSVEFGGICSQHVEPSSALVAARRLFFCLPATFQMFGGFGGFGKFGGFGIFQQPFFKFLEGCFSSIFFYLLKKIREKKPPSKNEKPPTKKRETQKT